MRKVTGKFEGTGSELIIGVGFKPDYVKVTNISSANLESIEFYNGMADVTAIAEGIKRSGDDATADSKLTAGNGISVYDGGDRAGSDNSKYLVRDSGVDFEAAAEDKLIPAGFRLEDDSDVNVDGEVCVFEAGFFD